VAKGTALCDAWTGAFVRRFRAAGSRAESGPDGDSRGIDPSASRPRARRPRFQPFADRTPGRRSIGGVSMRIKLASSSPWSSNLKSSMLHFCRMVRTARLIRQSFVRHIAVRLGRSTGMGRPWICVSRTEAVLRQVFRRLILVVIEGSPLHTLERRAGSMTGGGKRQTQPVGLRFGRDRPVWRVCGIKRWRPWHHPAKLQPSSAWANPWKARNARVSGRTDAAQALVAAAEQLDRGQQQDRDHDQDRGDRKDRR
jgi:hypothetical protein